MTEGTGRYKNVGNKKSSVGGMNFESHFGSSALSDLMVSYLGIS